MCNACIFCIVEILDRWLALERDKSTKHPTSSFDTRLFMKLFLYSVKFRHHCDMTEKVHQSRINQLFKEKNAQQAKTIDKRRKKGKQ